MANFANGNAQSNNDDWKSDFFVNFFLPNQDGGRRKVGAIGLKLSKAHEKELIEYLQADPSHVQKLLGAMEVTCASADGSSSAGFALPA